MPAFTTRGFQRVAGDLTQRTKALSAPTRRSSTMRPGEPFYSGEEAALRAFYGAKIEATRRSSSARDRVAAIRVLFDAQRAALRELASRRHAFKAATRQNRRIENAVRYESERKARPS